jgi:hypothetical protein
MHRLPAASPREFWGGRYNLLVGGLLHEAVFTPLRKQAGFSATTAALAVFAVSGALHAHVAVVRAFILCLRRLHSSQ